MLGTDVKVYVVCKMTGLYCDQMLREARKITRALRRRNITVAHPVIRERIPNVHKKLTFVSDFAMRGNWNGDKQDIKDAHVIVDTTPYRFSAGGKEEVGKARYRDWKPVVAFYPKGHEIPFIVREERDSCVYSENMLAEIIERTWGNRWRRMWWRLPIYLSHPFDISIKKIWEFFS